MKALGNAGAADLLSEIQEFSDVHTRARSCWKNSDLRDNFSDKFGH
jgi:hypothetical protein